MSTPQVSVIIPTYNRVDAIENAVKSVLNQTFSDLEIIIVDDASTDGTAERIESLNENKIKYFRHETNLFAGAARNTGMQNAKGQFIAFLDSDDTWHPDKLERQLGLLQANESCDICFAGVVLKKGRGYRERNLLPNYRRQDSRVENVFRLMTGRLFVITTTIVFRRSLCEQVGLMDVRLRRNQDIDFFVRLLGAADAVSVEAPVADFFPNYNPPSLDVVEQSNRTLLEKHRSLFDSMGAYRSSAIRAHYRFMHGLRHLERGRLTQGLRLLSSAILTNPILPLRKYASIVHRLGKRIVKR